MIDAIGSDIKQEGMVESAYPGTPLAPVLSLFEGADEVLAGLGAIRCATLLLSSREDHVVDPVSGDVLAEKAGGPVERVLPREQLPRGHAGRGRTADRVQGGRVRRGPPWAVRASWPPDGPPPPMSTPGRITRADVAHVARLARLELTDEELDLFTGQLAQVLDHAADVASLDLAGVEPTAHAMAVTNVLRPDEVHPCLDREEVLGQAPSVEDHRFRVPRILGEAP